MSFPNHIVRGCFLLTAYWRLWTGFVRGCSLLIAGCGLLTAFTWGFFAHKRINQLAVFTLPPEMVSFYKKNIDYLTDHSVDADRRRYSDPEEGARHYIDLDHYGAHPFDSIPKYWNDAVKKFSEDTLKAYGIVPWHIELMTYRLTQAFKEQDADKILFLSANLGHYIEDAHVPLHTTENYNGQLTGQNGIHGFWESRLPELFSDQWDFLVGRAKYVDKVNDKVWEIVGASFSQKDSVLKLEAELNSKWSPDKKYSFERKGGKTVKTYSAEYSEAYNKMLDGMVERKMRQSVLSVGSFWYTAWVDAGSPDLNHLVRRTLVSDSLKPEGVSIPVKTLRGHQE